MKDFPNRRLFHAGTRAIITFVIMLSTIAVAGQNETPGAPTAGGSAMSFALHTKAFTPGGETPKQYTCEGSDASPALTWDAAPQSAQSFAMIVDDPDAPVGTFTHWIIYNIPARSRGLPEGIPKSEQLPDGTRQGRNDFRRIGYGGPCPPPGKPHRYFFKLYALDTNLTLEPGASRQQLESAIKGHVLAESELMATYKR
jgi:Raf kinase inhibitor-like YbhB/YbcL family protein